MKNESKKEFIKNIVELLLIIAVVVAILVFFPKTVAWNIVVLLLILTALIFVHEFGHFIAAKKCGVHVYEFALGMGPKVLGFKRKNDPTEYNLRLLPIGGFCQMAGEDMADDKDLKENQFMCNKPKWQRAIILVAGVFMNFVTAFVVLFFISLVWGSTDQTSVIGSVQENSPAQEAGFVVGDRIVELNGYKISTWDKLTVITNFKNNNEYTYVIEHKDGKRETIKLAPANYVEIDNEVIRYENEEELNNILEEKKIKKEDAKLSKLIGIGADTEIKKGFVQALKYAVIKLGGIVSSMFLIVWSLITGKLGLNALSGPVGMYTVVGEVAAFGLANILYLAAYLSVNLGVINILPFPAFDGGRLLFVGIEAVTRKKVDAKVEAMFHNVGFILLMILMLYITFQDIMRLF